MCTDHIVMSEKKEKVILTYGTFDMFHVGHVRLLKRLKELGDTLIVGLSTDEFNGVKGKKSFFSFEERKEILLSCKYVDKVIPEMTWEQKVEDVNSYDVAIFAIGDDWQGKFDFLLKYCEVVYLERTENISTTKIKSELSKINTSKIDDIESQLRVMVDVLRAISSNGELFHDSRQK